MAGYTDHYALTTLNGSQDSFAADGYKFTDADRRLIDALLYLGAEGHRHTGTAAVVAEPSAPPTLSLSTSGGTIPGGVRVYYKYTYVNERGEESVGSAESFVDTPAPIAAPGAPTLTRATTGGILLSGNYYYVLSAYVGDPNSESRALSPVFITVPVGTVTNMITLALPSLPSGATGFNIYRRKPGDTRYFYLTSVNMSVATPPATYVDTGAVTEDCDRSLPIVNNTNGTNSITVSQPGATPAVPVGYTWRVYRTYIAGDYTTSFLRWVVEGITELSPIITPSIIDAGAGTSEGAPPDSTNATGSPSKIVLTDFEEVQGSLPLSAIAFPSPVTFQFSGPLQVAQGSATWRCPFPNAEIVSVEAYLGRGSAPTAQSVIVDVNKAASSLTPSYSTIYTTQASRPAIAAGNQVGTKTTPNTIALARGDLLTVDIDQVGGGATPTDRDLSVTIYLIAYGFPAVSYVAGSSGGSGGSF